MWQGRDDLAGNEDSSLTPQRRHLLRAIRKNPGITLSQLMTKMDFGWASLYHHLQLLEATGLIEIKKNPYDARKRHVFPAGSQADVRRTPTVLRPTRRDVAETVRERPGIGADELAERLGLTRQQVLYHLRLMHEQGLISSRSAEPFARVHPRKQLLTVLDAPAHFPRERRS